MHAFTCMGTHTRARTHTHTHARTHARKHTHSGDSHKIVKRTMKTCTVWHERVPKSAGPGPAISAVGRRRACRLARTARGSAGAGCPTGACADFLQQHFCIWCLCCCLSPHDLCRCPCYLVQSLRVCLLGVAKVAPWMMVFCQPGIFSAFSKRHPLVRFLAACLMFDDHPVLLSMMLLVVRNHFH